MAVERTRVYVWEFPVRFTHWINALCIVIFSVTGFYIGHPFIHAISSKQYIMGWMRLIHFIVGYTFLMSLIIRIYWAFMGNKYSSYRSWFPFSSRKFSELIGMIKYYSFLSRKPPYSVDHVHQHALAGFTYFVMHLLYIFQVVSGFAMYSVNHRGVIWQILGGWLLGSMDLQTIRLYHHFVMYMIMGFVMVHIYFGWFTDSRERNAIMSSMFSGFKYASEEDLQK